MGQSKKTVLPASTAPWHSRFRDKRRLPLRGHAKVSSLQSGAEHTVSAMIRFFMCHTLAGQWRSFQRKRKMQLATGLMPFRSFVLYSIRRKVLILHEEGIGCKR